MKKIIGIVTRIVKPTLITYLFLQDNEDVENC